MDGIDPLRGIRAFVWRGGWSVPLEATLPIPPENEAAIREHLRASQSDGRGRRRPPRVWAPTVSLSTTPSRGAVPCQRSRSWSTKTWIATSSTFKCSSNSTTLARLAPWQATSEGKHLFCGCAIHRTMTHAKPAFSAQACWWATAKTRVESNQAKAEYESTKRPPRRSTRA